MNIAILASGNGSNLQALIDAEKAGDLSTGRIVLVLSDKKEAFALKRAARAGIETEVQEKDLFSCRKEYDGELLRKLERRKIDLIVLAGFMRILSIEVVKAYSGKILNVHPALLPAFKGGNAIREAYDYGVKVTGVTVHLVDEEVDTGPILAQEVVRVTQDQGIDGLEEAIHKAEHDLYPKVVRDFIDKKYEVEGRKTRYLK